MKIMDDLFDFPDSEEDAQGIGDSIFSVTQLTRKIRNLLQQRIGEVWVEGEISNLRKHSSGHQYFTLKDEGAQISCVLFRNNARKLTVPLDDGQKVQILGQVSVYQARGNYQIIVDLVQDKGLGALQAKFEALKRKLDEEGLFDSSVKKNIPSFPSTICLITSPTGAALRDMLSVLGRRAPWVRVLIYPVRVQGKGAAEEISAALEHLSTWNAQSKPEIDAVVITRGGGSLEDIWAFNEEQVARAISKCRLPVVSAIGHEIDFTIADFVADLRAPTPSAAAELIVPEAEDLRTRLGQMGSTLQKTLCNSIDRHVDHLEFMSNSSLLKEPKRIVSDLAQDNDRVAEKLRSAFKGAISINEDLISELRHKLTLLHPVNRLETISGRLSILAARLTNSGQATCRNLSERCSSAAVALKNLGPNAVLARGYSITLDEDGKLIESAKSTKTGDRIISRFSDGKVHSTVE
ncbi:MAG: exodeoxyribonuclease VII large subunit [Verrucomicrobiaceae bacterium]|nr:exodeoxyribonuclease VII large subunit [Verrucomicrobiaceae bacterium]